MTHLGLVSARQWRDAVSGRVLIPIGRWSSSCRQDWLLEPGLTADPRQRRRQRFTSARGISDPVTSSCGARHADDTGRRRLSIDRADRDGRSVHPDE
jgi:hypothetical protein